MKPERIRNLIDDVLLNPELESCTRMRLVAAGSVVDRVAKRQFVSANPAEALQPNARSTSDPGSKVPITTTASIRKPQTHSKPLEIVWRHSCSGTVSVHGTFTEQPWIEIKMQRDKQDGFFKVDLSDWGLSPGTYIFKFVVDGEWRIDPTLPTRSDLNGHINNTIFVRSSARPLKSVRSAPTVETIPSGACSGMRSATPSYGPNTPLARESTSSFHQPYFPRQYDVLTSDRQSTSLALICGGWMIPHPEKIASGGADSFFFSTRAAGVADGVGEWEWRFKLDPRKFAEQLMKGCLTASEVHANEHCNSSADVEQRAKQVLTEGYELAHAFGSSTACVLTLDSAGERVGVANLGDSGLVHFRKQFLTGALSMTCVMRTREQQHGFNTPFQLSRLPDRDKYDEIAQDPLYVELISSLRTLTGRQLSKIDKPGDADLYSSKLKEGDLLLLATDGVLDNLWNYDLLATVGEEAVVSPFDARTHELTDGPTDPEAIARGIAAVAYEKSLLTSGYKSPFGVECRKRTGQVHLGGKADDITVVACWVARQEDAEAMIAQIEKKRREVDAKSINSVLATRPAYCGTSTCRDWWKAQRGKPRHTSSDDVRRTSRYERFMSNEPI